MVRNLRGHYAKTNTGEGVGYVMYPTKAQAQQYVADNCKDGGYVVKVRTTITPIDSARAERLVAVRQARPTAYAVKNQNQQELF
jgi:hypothetical protein